MGRSFRLRTQKEGPTTKSRGEVCGQVPAAARNDKAGKFDEQLEQFLVNDSEPSWDPQSLPVYLPEALVSMPQIIPPVAKTSVARSPEDDTQVLKDTDTSLAHRLNYLKRLLRANHEEEVACGLHLSTVLDMPNA
uniref:Uncharacterized protein n=1 Tax=Sphaerodactylus townsendi TaxID=933632 RepID=A0ACB8GFQ2_9SAUR